jgi:hypothetical protein
MIMQLWEEAMTAKINGGCACGAVRYEIAADPQFQGQCQCRDCRRATGTGHADGLGFPEMLSRWSAH